MPFSNTFQCTIITPEREVLNEPATSAVFTAHDGEIGILLNRAPLVTKLGIGHVRVDGPSGTREFFIDGGFAQMLNNVLTILTEQAQAVEDINLASAQQALADASALKISDAGYAARDRAIQRAQAQIKLAPRS